MNLYQAHQTASSLEGDPREWEERLVMIPLAVESRGLPYLPNFAAHHAFDLDSSRALARGVPLVRTRLVPPLGGAYFCCQDTPSRISVRELELAEQPPERTWAHRQTWPDAIEEAPALLSFYSGFFGDRVPGFAIAAIHTDATGDFSPAYIERYLLGEDGHPYMLDSGIVTIGEAVGLACGGLRLPEYRDHCTRTASTLLLRATIHAGGFPSTLSSRMESLELDWWGSRSDDDMFALGLAPLYLEELLHSGLFRPRRSLLSLPAALTQHGEGTPFWYDQHIVRSQMKDSGYSCECLVGGERSTIGGFMARLCTTLGLGALTRLPRALVPASRVQGSRPYLRFLGWPMEPFFPLQMEDLVHEARLRGVVESRGGFARDKYTKTIEALGAQNPREDPLSHGALLPATARALSVLPKKLAQPYGRGLRTPKYRRSTPLPARDVRDTRYTDPRLPPVPMDREEYLLQRTRNYALLPALSRLRGTDRFLPHYCRGPHDWSAYFTDWRVYADPWGSPEAS